MATLGLAPPPVPTQQFAAPAAMPMPAFKPPAFGTPKGGNLGGVLPFANTAAVLEQKRQAMTDSLDAQQQAPVIAGLSGHIHTFWNKAKHAKRVKIFGYILAIIVILSMIFSYFALVV